MDRISLESLLPSFNFKDIDVGLYSPSDRRIHPYSALRGFKRAAIDLDVEYKKRSGRRHQSRSSSGE